MDMILYHEVMQGKRVQGTMFPAGVWGFDPSLIRALPLTRKGTLSP